MKYENFLKSKVIISESFGINTDEITFSDKLFPHQKDIANWALQGGRRAIFATFGLGKSFMQLEIGKQLMTIFNKPFLIVMPLAVAGEFKRDNEKLETGFDIDYITDTDDFNNLKTQFYITNYERVRKGDIDPSHFIGCSFDEASILRNLQTDTTNYILKHFGSVPYRFVATATPTPNDFVEILNYAEYLGVASRGHLLTRFFQRDSQKAGNLKLYENKKKEFWQWVSTWAVFINDPSDLGYDNSKYILPKLNVIEHCINYQSSEVHTDKFGKPILFKDSIRSMVDVSKEKRDSITPRISKALEIIRSMPNDSCILWHHRESEREVLEKEMKGLNFISVYGSQPNKIKEENLIDFSNDSYQYLITKPQIAGSGCNLQNCHNMIFVGIDYKFNDFIQSIHREYRFGQTNEVNVHIIYTNHEYEIIKALKKKWNQHKELQAEMIDLVRNNGLNSNLIKSQMERQIFENGKKVILQDVTAYNNDTVLVHQNKDEMPDNSVHLYLTSIPFGDHYEYSDNYNDFGHNHGNDKFFEQMDYLTPEMLRCLKPGRIAAIHVKDRIRYSYQNGTSFTTIKDFSGQTVTHYEKHGFHLIGKITITTDVVAENNQTYRLGWTEKCKDGSKMGVGLPEYVLLFRKAPTSNDNSYADEPLVKSKNDYTKALWQLDAHSYWRSSGDRFMTKEEIKRMDVSTLCKLWKEKNGSDVYDFKEHLRICEEMDELEKLSSTFMTLPVHSNSEFVWTDVNRMLTLNAHQVNAKKEKHICPLQFDIIERLINTFSNPGEIVCDPFGGLGSTAYKAIEMGRKAITIELNSQYFADSLYYLKSKIYHMNVPTLFDAI